MTQIEVLTQMNTGLKNGLKLLFLFGFFVFLAACSTKFEVKSVDGTAPAMGTVEDVGGLPFREARVHKIHLYAYDSTKGEYVKVSAQDKLIASPDGVYALAGKPKYLSSKTLKTKYRQDGTLSSADLSSESQVLKSLNNVFGEVETLQTASEAKDTAAAEALTASNSATLACVEAQVEVNKADATLSALPDTATELERVIAEGAVEIAQTKRNISCVSDK